VRDLHVPQVVREPRSRDASSVRVNDVAFEEIEAYLVAQSEVVRVPDEACIPPEEGLDTPDHLRPYGFQARDEIGDLRRVGDPQETPHSWQRSVYRRSGDGAGYIGAEPLDVEGVVQERVAGVIWNIGNIEDRIQA
jgi:hypothetical protein